MTAYLKGMGKRMKEAIKRERKPDAVLTDGTEMYFTTIDVYNKEAGELNRRTIEAMKKKPKDEKK